MIFEFPKARRVKFREEVVRELLEIGSRSGLPAGTLRSWIALPEVSEQIALLYGSARSAATVAVLLFHDFVAEMHDFDVGPRPVQAQLPPDRAWMRREMGS